MTAFNDADDTDPAAVVAGFVAAWERNDPAEILTFFAEDAEWYEGYPADRYVGHSEISTQLERYSRHISDVSIEVIHQAAEGDVVFQERIDRVQARRHAVCGGRGVRVRRAPRADRRESRLLEPGRVPPTIDGGPRGPRRLDRRRGTSRIDERAAVRASGHARIGARPLPTKRVPGPTSPSAPFLPGTRREFGTLPAVIDGRHRRSWGELVDAAARFAGFLAAAGVGPGDVVTWQLPNWWESLVVAYGIWAAGAVSNPVTEISREHELRQIVEQVHPVCVVTAEQFRDCRHTEMWTEVCRQTGQALRGRVVVRGSESGWTTFADTLVGQPAVLSSVDVDVDVDEPALVVMTSGTTSGAKGVVHSTRSYLSYPLRTCRWVGAGWADRTLSPFPLGHVSGMIWAVAVPLFTGGSTVIADRWDPEFAVHAIRDGGVTYTGGPAPFAQVDPR